MADIPSAPIVKTFEALPQPASGLGAREVIHWISTERVDRSRDVVVADGGDWSDFAGNRPVTFQHSEKLEEPSEFSLPVGVCKWWKVARHPAYGRGVMARTEFDDDPFALRVCSKYKAETPSLTSWSLTFLPEPGTYGAPTAAELTSNPHWKGAKRIFRRWKPLCYSAVLLPDNPSCTTISKSIFGDKQAMSDAVSAEAETPTAEAVAATETPAVETPEAVETPAPIAKSTATAEEVEDAEDDEEPPVKRGDHVKCFAPHAKGCGKVVSVHEGEMVPDVEEDCYGTKDNPAVRVKMCKRMGGACQPSGVHKGMHRKHVEKCEPMKASKSKSADIAPAPQGWTPEQKAAYKAARLASPDFHKALEASVAEAFDIKVRGKV